MASSIVSRWAGAACLFTLASALCAQTVTAHFSGAQQSIPTGQASGGFGIAVDAAGSIYVEEISGYGILKETLSGGTYTASTIPTSFLEAAAGLAVDAQGNVYVAEAVNSLVYKETLSGGTYTESIMPFSGLDLPQGVAVDSNGNVYVADYFNQRIVKATPSGNTYTQSTVPTSGLSYPGGVAVDGSGNLYISDSLNYRILKAAAGGGKNNQSTILNLAGNDGRRPEAMAVDARGNLYIVDYFDPSSIAILKETLSGSSYSQSTVATTSIANPDGLAVDAQGNIFVSGRNNQIEKLQPSAADFGAVNVADTSAGISLIFTFDTGGNLGSPRVFTLGSLGLDFADAGTGSCTSNGKSHTYRAGDLCTLDVTFKPQSAGARLGAGLVQDGFQNALASGYVYGTGLGPQATFPPGTSSTLSSGLSHPFGVALDGQGDVFFAESDTGTVYEGIRSGKNYTRKAIANGLNQPKGVVLDGRGDVYVAAAGVVYKETVAGSGYAQTAMVTDLSDPIGVAVDGGGNLYITDGASGDVHKATLEANGSYSEMAIGGGISGPTAVAVDGGGNIYITDARAGTLYKEMPRDDGSYQQATIAGGLGGPEGVAVDAAGNLYVTASTTGEVYEAALQGNGSYTQSVAVSGLNTPWGIALDAQGNLYLSHDTAKGDLTLMDVADAPGLGFAKTRVGVASVDSPRTVTVANIGNAPLAFPVPGAGSNPSIATNFTLSSASTCPEVGAFGVTGSLPAGAACEYTINFLPVARGSINGSLVMTDTNLNADAPSYARQSIALQGTATTTDATRTTMRVSPSQIAAGLGVTITVTVTDTTAAANVVTGGVTLSDSVGGTTVSLNSGAGVPLSEGVATLTISPRVAGTHTITAHYRGADDSFAGSTGQASLTVK